VALLLGRTRPVDRDAALQTLLPRMRAGRENTDTRPLFVVATQCIEAGADLDFDALVTEIAPLDCLRQRFGRLNRLGRRDQCASVVLAASDQAGGRLDDPIYGTASRATWRFLLHRDIADFGITATQEWMPQGEDLKPLLAPRRDAPLLLPRDVGLWSCTMPRPAVEPDVALYLHGPDTAPADVHVVWRAELDPDNPEMWAERIDACPPLAAEAMPVPIGEVRLWLVRKAFGDVADVEGAGEDTALSGQGRQFVLWRNGEAQLSVRPSTLLPGDTIVVSSDEGGADRWGWHPQSRTTVEDVAGAAMVRPGRGRQIVVRLSPRLAPALAPAMSEMADFSDRGIQALVASLLDVPEDWRASLLRGRGKVIRCTASEMRMPIAIMLRPASAVSEDDSASLAASQPRSLVDHTDGVVRQAQRFVQQVGFTRELAEDVSLAARLHDAGKAHPAFQRFLYGGDELAAIGSAVLAKSERRLGREAGHRAALPQGARHEVASLRVAEAHPAFAAAHDPALVLWLIGTHHGHGRPLFPPVPWPAPGEIFDADPGGGYGAAQARPALTGAALAARWLELRDALHRRYGPWCLAHLEAVLRLADHRCSEQEARGP
jgi:CRISPR-associated endonuclease/helicase Cas3